MRETLFLLCCMVASQAAKPQLHWQKADSAYQPLPPSIHLFKTRDSMNGRPIVAYYLSAKLKDKKLYFGIQTGNGSLYTPRQYFQRENAPLVIVNCAFFSPVTNQNLSVIIKNGKLVARNITSLKGRGKDSALYYYITRSAIGIDKKRNADVAWVFTTLSKKRVYAFESGPVVEKNEYVTPDIFDLNDVDWKWWKMQTAVGGGPTLIHNGEIRITNQEEQIAPEKERQARTAMGYTKDDRLIILVIQEDGFTSQGATFEQEAKVMKSLGCYKALNLDGGKNSALVINGKKTVELPAGQPEPELPAVFMIKSQ